MTRRRALGVALAGALALTAGSPAAVRAQSPFGSAGPGHPVPRHFPAPTPGFGTRPDAGVIVAPPAYPAPGGPVVPLPGGRPPPPPLPPDQRDRLHRPGGPLVWTPGRYEVVPGIDERGRVVHEYRWVPGRFESHFDR